ncbi:MAG: biotin/lipoyl-binding protein [Thermoplasmata archaeon]|nr:biotin/lipoyl-binding protein [Thermoplasmata archaeon]
MRLTLTVDGEPVEVDADLERGEVEILGKRFPVKLLSTGPDRVELEIGGARVVVAGWPAGAEEPPVGVSVSGEVFRVEIARRAEGPSFPSDPAPARTGSSPPSREVPATTGGVAVHPPMPGKILEVRVTDGQQVRAGEVLLVLEAMKMRNEIPSPIAGRVESVSVRPGDSVRARDLLLRIVGS